MGDTDTSKNASASSERESDNPSNTKPRISAVVGLVLLEVIRTLDLPAEILSSEDPSQTMPRRLGLSEAVDLQIRRFREEVRRKARIRDDELRDLSHLVLRRPDSDQVFYQAGENLAGGDLPKRGLAKTYPQRVRYSLARRQVRRRLKSLLGRSVGAFAPGDFTLEARGHFLLELDPGGDACALLTGFSQAILSSYFRKPLRVAHTSCQALKHDLCRWTVVQSDS